MGYNGKFQVAKLGPLCTKIGSGATPRGGKDTYLESGPFSLIRSQNIQNNRFTIEGLARISAEQAGELDNVQVEAGDVLLNITGDSVARCCQAPRNVLPARVNQHVTIIRPDTNVLNPTFLRYFLVSPQMQGHMLMLAGAGATRNALTKGMIEDFNVPLPDIVEQRNIGQLLGALDDKIALNAQMNETMEALGRTIFKSWFVDTTDASLPEGWREVTLSNCCENIFSGGTPSTQSPAYWGGDIPWLSSGETRSKFIIDTEKTITSEGVANSSTRLAHAGATVIAGAGQGHTRGQTSYLTFDSYINQSVVALIADQSVSSDIFLFFDLERRYEQFRQISDSHSSRGSLTGGLLSNLKVFLPPRKMIEKFDEIVKPTTHRIIYNLHESRTLAALRDTLLPKLLSGDLRVPQAKSLEVKQAEFNIVPLPIEPAAKPARKTTDEFVEAVMIAQLVRSLATPRFPLGRMRYNKYAYLAHRKVEDDVTEHYLKKAAGPYSPWAKYQGPEDIACKNGYVKNVKVGQLAGFVAGDRIADIDRYVPKYPCCAAVNWVVAKFKFRKNDDLELLATVDYAALDLIGRKEPVSFEGIKHVIATNKEWAAKLKRDIFSDANIKRALTELLTVFPGTYAT